MFISFGMFIALIIATIIMILLIIYLTFTSGKGQTNKHDNQIKAEEEAKARLAQHNPEQTDTLHSTMNTSDLPKETQHDFQQNTYSQHEVDNVDAPVEDDDYLHVLPYPKDDEYK
ncbi:MULTISPECIES: hypothetical protein [unclassified Enterococcus]|uniref:hypothetical protein n=1 Tax=unclassified Enterococcus TaxID=2608891 RepID=UPI001CE17077|nr:MULTISPECIES: hypothetical protein [unclassified Enterococcus]MCA5012716.1 hypothetical protein [Enterococcus sp. S23]MCA5015967.1 hypothetical protein [Enterococcus sp. S22(2020)]